MQSLLCSTGKVGLHSHRDGKAGYGCFHAAPLSIPSGRSFCGRLTGIGLGLRLAPLKVSSRAAEPTDDEADMKYYNRQLEEEKFDNIIMSAPNSVHAMVGPRNSGKSRTARHILKKYSLDGLCYLNCRTMTSTTPERFALTVLKLGLPSLMKNEEIVKIAAKISRNHTSAADNAIAALTQTKAKFSLNIFRPSVRFDLAEAVRILLGNLEQETKGKITLLDMMNVIERFAEAWAVARRQNKVKGWPCIIADEANLLLAWRDKNLEELQQLVAFFIAITKELGLCHVFLLTSEFGFLELTRDVLPPEFRTTIVLGDFTQEQAQGFIELCLQQYTINWQADWQEQWPRVYKVCGGNAGALKIAACRYQVSGNWEEALEDVCRDIFGTVKEAACGGPGYTAQQYRAVALRLLQKVDESSSPGSTINPVMPTLLAEDLCNMLGNGNYSEGKKILNAMIQHNAFSIRPPSSWAQDIPKHSELVVTAPSTRHLYCMIQQRDKLQGLEDGEADRAERKDLTPQKEQGPQDTGGISGSSKA